MSELYAVLLSIALVDSTSVTPLSLVPLATMLAGRRPYLTAGMFLGGLYVSYLIMALAFLYGMGAILDRLNAWVSNRWYNPGAWDFGFEILLGIVLLVFGIRIMEKRREKTAGRKVKEGISPGGAFGFGFMINVVGFPGAVPYFAAADRIHQADLAVGDAVLAVVFYVVVFILPLVSLVLLRALLGSRMDPVMTAIKRFFDTWGKRLMIVLMLVLGAFLVVDGVFYFVTDSPLVPVGWPAASPG
jgi:cytochrome c biogenesis protein CcdA